MSKVVGIIAEYNPFHNGHSYHIQNTKAQTGADFVVAVMTGNFTQRGNTSVINKWEKAKMALNGDADLVIEVPTIYSVSSAENFANGAVKILNELGSGMYKVPVLELTNNTDKMKQIINNNVFDTSIKRLGIKLTGFTIEFLSLDEESNLKISQYEINSNSSFYRM